MEKIRNSFEKLYKKFAKKIPTIKKKIEHFAASDMEKEHKRGHALLEEAEKQVQQIRHDFEQENNINVADLEKKINDFKKIYKELNELSKPEWIQWGEALVVAIVVVFLLRNFVFGLYHVPSGSAEPTLLVGDRVLGNKMAYLGGKKPKINDLVMFDDPNFEYDQHNKFNYLWQRFIGVAIPMLGLGSGPDNLVKRVVAGPKDTIEGRVEGGKTVIYRNGKKLNEPYVNKYPLIAMERKTGFIDLDSIGPIPIPKFLKKDSKYPLFYTYVPDLSFSLQPYYNMTSDEVGLKPGTLRPWLLEPGEPSRNEFGKDVDIFGPHIIPEGKYWVMGDSRQNSKDSRFWGLLDGKHVHGRASLVLYSIDSEEPLWLFEFIKSPIRFWSRSVRWSRTFKKLGVN